MSATPRVRIRKDRPAPAAAPQAASPPAAATATQEAIQAALKETVLTDAGGRRIVLRKPSVLAQFRLTDAMGDKAQNQKLLEMCQPLTFVAELGNEPVFFPSTWNEIEALIERLGEDGLNVVMLFYMQNVVLPFNEAMDSALAQARLKNG